MKQEFLDCKGMRCPMPIVEIFKRMKEMNVGDILTVEADDMAFSADIRAWCEQAGQKIIELSCEGAVKKVVLEKTK